MKPNDIQLVENQLQLVTYEQAKRLKAAGFDWYTDFSFINANIVRRIGRSNAEVADRAGEFCAPTVALALKWFRDVKGSIFLTGALITSDVDGETQIFYKYALCTDIETDAVKCEQNFLTCEEAESALLDTLLTELEASETACGPNCGGCLYNKYEINEAQEGVE